MVAHVFLITMEEKEDRIEIGAFFDALEKELGMDKTNSKHAIVERKPLLPKKQAIQRSIRPQASSQVNSIKIQRKTPLDYMIRKNKELKATQSKKLPTYSDFDQKFPPKKEISYQNRPRSLPQSRTYNNNPSTSSNSTLYPRYTIDDKPKPKPLSPTNHSQENSYLRTQMLKELRTQQKRKPVALSRSRLQPPRVVVPPQPTPPAYNRPISQTTNQISSTSDPYEVFYPEETDIDYVNEHELIQCLQQIRDKTKIDVLIELLDGKWHNESELLRIAKKTRDFIGVVGFGMLMCSFEDTVTKSFLRKKVNTENCSWYKINENFIQLARSAYSKYKTEEK